MAHQDPIERLERELRKCWINYVRSGMLFVALPSTLVTTLGFSLVFVNCGTDKMLWYALPAALPLILLGVFVVLRRKQISHMRHLSKTLQEHQHAIRIQARVSEIIPIGLVTTICYTFAVAFSILAVLQLFVGVYWWLSGVFATLGGLSALTCVLLAMWAKRGAR